MPAKNFSGAGNEGRTRNLQLGRLSLCQLSYSRTFQLFLAAVQTPKNLQSFSGLRSYFALQATKNRLAIQHFNEQTFLFPNGQSFKKLAAPYEALAEYGGEGWIRTSEGIADGFTVHPLWPLGNLAAPKHIPQACSTIILFFSNDFNLNFDKKSLFYQNL